MLGIDRKAWELLVDYLGYIRKHGKLKMVCLRECGDSWEWWFRNEKRIWFVLQLWFGVNSYMEISEVYWYTKQEKNVMELLEKGPAIRRRTFLRILERLLRGTLTGGTDLTGSIGCMV
jgi:hypothetical protein